MDGKGNGGGLRGGAAPRGDILTRVPTTAEYGKPGPEGELIQLAEQTGPGTVQVNFNRGAMPREMFLEQLRRFARDVLPILQAHQIVAVPADAGQRMPE